MSTHSEPNNQAEDESRVELQDGPLVDAVANLSDDDLAKYRRELRADISRQDLSAKTTNVYQSPQYRAYRLSRHLQIAEEEASQRKNKE